jgi:low affinity Fe/Cu permease
LLPATLVAAAIALFVAIAVLLMTTLLQFSNSIDIFLGV